MLPAEDAGGQQHHASRRLLEVSAQNYPVCSLVLRAAVANYQDSRGIRNGKGYWRQYNCIHYKDGSRMHQMNVVKELGVQGLAERHRWPVAQKENRLRELSWRRLESDRNMQSGTCSNSKGRPAASAGELQIYPHWHLGEEYSVVWLLLCRSNPFESNAGQGISSSVQVYICMSYSYAEARKGKNREAMPMHRECMYVDYLHL